MARVDWTGQRDIAEALIKSIQPDDPTPSDMKSPKLIMA